MYGTLHLVINHDLKVNQKVPFTSLWTVIPKKVNHSINRLIYANS